jgi:hypothetical protein
MVKPRIGSTFFTPVFVGIIATAALTAANKEKIIHMFLISFNVTNDEPSNKMPGNRHNFVLMEVIHCPYLPFP